MNISNLNISCSFCEKKQNDVDKIIAGNKVYICNKCINLFKKILNSHSNKEKIKITLKPIDIKKKLDSYIIGQKNTKKILSVTIYNHYKLINKLKKKQKLEYKNNILLIGPTGSGKTLLAKTISKIMDIPFIIADATTLTEAGYVGEDVENILYRLLLKCDFNIKKAENGIIFIDEIDKISRKRNNPSITRDVSGEGVQQSLLKIIEGTISHVLPQGGRKHPHKEFIQIDTSNILFICSGTFDGINKIIKNRINHSQIGFIKNKKFKSKNTEIKTEDLIEFGLIPEFIGRLQIFSKLKKLNKKDLFKILIKPKNSIIDQYKFLFKLENIKLTFKKKALKKIADKAFKKQIGARGLKNILENILIDTMYKIPSQKNIKEIIIDKSVVSKKTKPIIIKNT